MLAGPGRQDLTGEFGLDVTVPGYHSARYAGTARVRQGTRGLVNPISVPTILAAPGLALENWSGSEAADAPWLERLLALGGAGAAADVDGPARRIARAVRRALLFDLRNLGTLGLQQDSFPGLLWADAIYGHADAVTRPRSRAIPALYAATAVRAVLADAVRTAAAATAGAIARGRAHLQRARRRRDRQPPDPEDRPARLRGRQARGADPGADRSDQAARREAGRPLRRLSHRRAAREQAAARREPAAARPLLALPPRAHPRRRWTALRAPSVDAALLPVSALPLGRQPADEVAFCEGCHSQHRDFGPLVYSSSRLFPFDADGDGDAQLHPAADRRAGGIGTDPWLAFDVPRARVAVRARRPDHLRPDARRPRRSGAHRRRLGARRAAGRPRRQRALPPQRVGPDAARAARSARPAPRHLPARRGGLRLRHAPARQRQPGPRLRHRAHARPKRPTWSPSSNRSNGYFA